MCEIQCAYLQSVLPPITVQYTENTLLILYSDSYFYEYIELKTMAKEPDEKIIRKELETDTDDPAVQVAESVAEIEEKETTDLAAMYECVDGVLDNIFSQPPDPTAQMQIEFSYETYRITIHQDGIAEFVKTE